MFNVVIFMASHGLALLSLWLQRFLVAWYLWRTTEKPLVLGLAIACELLPGLILLGRIGSDLDRGNQSRIVRSAQLAAALAAGLLALAMWGAGPVAALALPILLVSGTGGAYLLSGRFSLLGLLRTPSVPLERLSATMALTGQLATLLAPLVGGLALHFVPEWQAMLFVALGYILSSQLLGRVDLETQAGHRGAYDSADGWGRLRQLIGRSRVLFSVLAIFLLVQTGGRAVTDLLSGYVGQVLGGDAALLSVMTALTAVGGLCATLIALYLSATSPLIFMALALAAAVAALAMMPASWSMAMQGAAMVLLGAALSLTSVASQIYLQKRSPLQVRGRLMTTYTMIWRGSPVLAALTIGPAIHWLGFQYLPLLAGLFVALGVAVARWGRPWSAPAG